MELALARYWWVLALRGVLAIAFGVMTFFWPGLFWLVVVLLAPALGAAWVFHPTILYAVAYGCEPGAAVLLFVLGLNLLGDGLRRRPEQPK